MPSARRWAEDRDGIVSSSPLEGHVWDVIRKHKKLNDVASIRNGIIPGPAQRETHIGTARRSAEWRPWLGGTTALEPYGLKPERQEFINYPGNLLRPRLDLEATFGTPRSKVLVNANRAPGNPWRVYAAIDEFGYFPSQGFHCVTAIDDLVSLEELVAVLNSSIANAWVDSLDRSRWIGRRTLEIMPFPIFTDSVRESIVGRVRRVMALKRQALVGSTRSDAETGTIRGLVESIDDLVCNAFGVGNDGRSMLNKYFAGYQRRGLEWDGFIQPIAEDGAFPNGRAWPISGQVLQVDAENEVLTLWVRGYSEEQAFLIAIPETMPGWALRQGARFHAEIPWESRDSERLIASEVTNFRPLDFSYTSTEELVDLLRNPMKLDGIYGI